MDVNEILNALNGVLDLGDTLDSSGIGISSISNGQHTTRELCKSELGIFLLYVGDGGDFFNEGQAGLVNLLLSDQFGQIPTWQMKAVAGSINVPVAEDNVTFSAFQAGDEALTRQNGRPSTQLTDLLISLYESFGGLMVALNDNALSRVRSSTYINGLKVRQGSGSFSTSSTAKPAAAKPAAASKAAIQASDEEIDRHIPAGVTLTDTQREYLAGVVGAMKMYGQQHVTKSHVAIFMKKDTSAVSSGIRPLIKKGILEINDDAEIVIAEKKPEAVSPKPAGTSAGKAKTSAKTAAKKTLAGQDARYNDQVSFALSREYEMTWEKNKDGEDQCKIVSLKRADGDSDNPETTVIVSVIKNDDPDKDPFEIIQKGDDKSTFIPLDSEPDGLLCITYLDMQILSMNFRTSLYRLYLKLSREETLLLFYTSTSSGGENKFFEDFSKLTEIWRFVRIDGEAVDLGSADEAKRFATYMKELADNEGKPKKKKASAGKTVTSGAKVAQKKAETIIRTKASKFPDAGQYKGIHQVEDEPESVSPFGTWFVPVPAGCSYTMDPDCAGGGFAGKYPLQIQSTEDRDFSRTYDSRFSFAVFSSGIILKAFSSLIDLSTDEAGDEIMQLVSKADTRYEFFKRTASLAIMTKAENAEKNDYAVVFLIFTRGTQYGAMGQIVVHGKTKKQAKEEIDRVLNSVSVIAPAHGDEGVTPVVIGDRYALSYHEHNTLKLDNGIILPVPDGFKGSDDQTLIGAPRVFGIVPKDFKDYKKAMDATIGITAVPIQGDVPRYAPGIRDKICGIITEQFEQQEIFVPGAPRVVAQMTTGGIAFYQKQFGSDTYQYLGAKGILWADKIGYIISFAINLDEKIADRNDVGNDAFLLISDWMNRIQLPGEKLYYIPSEEEQVQAPDRIDNLISSPTPDLLHEHFDLITGGGYTTRRDADFIGQSIRGLMEKCGSAGEDAYDEMKIAGDAYDLDKSALKLAKVFRLDEKHFDPYSDPEALIRIGAFKDVRMFHALRSLSWMVSRYSEKEKRPLGKITFDELQKMGRIIEKKKFLNYEGGTGFAGLCGHYDWHVFYVPEKYRDGSTAMTTDLRYLTGKENRGGNTVSVFIPGITDTGSINRNSNIISRNEETLESLDALRKDLKDLLPVMETIHDGLLDGRDRSQKLEGPLSDALNAWCALAVAAKEPFYSEEAADTPEANAGLEGPLERPEGELDDKPGNGKKGKKSAAKPAAPAGDVLELNGATAIEPNQFAGHMELKNIIIPEGVTEIGERAFYSCMNLESVVLPKSLRKIRKFAFMSCRSLRKVEIPEGVEEIETHAFGATNNLKEVHLPDSLKKVDRCLFGLGGDSPYATAYLSGRLAKQLYDINGDAFDDIYARHLIIDGKPYDSVKEYLYQEHGIRVKGYYPPYNPEAAEREKEERKKNYRSDMEKACKEGKTLDEMIEAGRKKVRADTFGDNDAFELAVQHLDRNASVIFTGKHFVLTGFGDNEEEVIAEIEKRGGIVHSSMVKMADYLVVCLYGPGASKVKKALEWRQKGTSNLIVSDYQMWQAVFGKTVAAASDSGKAVPEKKPAPAPKTGQAAKPAPAPKTGQAAKPAPTPKRQPKTAKPDVPKTTPEAGDIAENGIRFDVLNDKSPVIKGNNYWKLQCKYLEIPEGVTELEYGALAMGEFEIVKLPRSMRVMGNSVFSQCSNLRKIIFQEGLEKLGVHVFTKCPKLEEIHLPESIRVVQDHTFSKETFAEESLITVYLSGKAARTICAESVFINEKEQPYAKGFVIDGTRYSTLYEFIHNPKPVMTQPAPAASVKPVVQPATQPAAQPAAQQFSVDEQKKFRRNQLRKQIHDLEVERDNVRGLFAGIKRKKIQAQIDELREELLRT